MARQGSVTQGQQDLQGDRAFDLGEAPQVLFEYDSAAAGIVSLIARERHIPVGLILHPSRCQAGVAEARQLAMYLMHVVLQRSFSDIGMFFGRDRTTVGHACACMEDRRDDPAFEREVRRLEKQIKPVPVRLPRWLAGEAQHARH